jgi:all-trans-retinol 13,14-reductase
VNKLADDIKAMGGTILCRHEVVELTEHEGKIAAVRCQNGEQYEASTFISDAHPAVTVDWMKESHLLKGMYRRRMKALENTFGIFTVSLELKPDVLPYFNHNKYVYKKPNVWTFYEDVGGIGGVMISCRVPEDKQTYTQQVDLLTPMPWRMCEAWKDTTIGHRGDEYMNMKQRMAQECIQLAETVIPGLGEMVTRQYTSTPLTYRDYTLTPEGSAYGVRKDCRSVMLTMLSPQSPIPNLLFTGQNMMLHGLEGVAMTAMNTTRLLLK